MLEAGQRAVAAEGLSISLEHLRMEDLTRAAGVSRTSSYRRWPTKDTFAADLLLELAQATQLSGEIEGLADALRSLPSEVFARLDTELGRRNAVIAILRITFDTDFQVMLRSPDWRLYTTIRVGYLGLPDHELREKVALVLRDTERRFTQARAAALKELASLIGYRPHNTSATSWDDLSLMVGSTSTGLLIRGYSDPSAVTESTPRAAFEASLRQPWNAASLALVGAFLATLEPDPTVIWDAARIEGLTALIQDFDSAIEHIVGEAN